MQRLTVLYDEDCQLCVRAAAWLTQQAQLVPLELVAADSPPAAKRFSRLPWRGYELCVISDAGDAWVGPAAFIMCLWALTDYREWSYRLSGDAFAPLAERFFRMLSRRRRSIAQLFRFGEDDCASGSCRTCDPTARRY
jgi:predicted DCC family thiol-disulfide oxidoreductase YuxK